MDDELRERLGRKTAEAHRRLWSEREGESHGGGRRPEPGQLFLLRSTADHEIEWLLVDISAEGFWIVPADTVPLVGPGDLVVSDTTVGPLTVRCAFGLSLPLGRLETSLRTGELGASALEEVRALCHALRDGKPHGTPAQADVARDPDYREWAGVLASARSAALP